MHATAAQRAAYTLAGTIVAYTFVVTCLVDIGDPRQRRPTDALLIFMGAVGILIWRRTVTSLRTGIAAGGRE